MDAVDITKAESIIAFLPLYSLVVSVPLFVLGIFVSCFRYHHLKFKNKLPDEIEKNEVDDMGFNHTVTHSPTDIVITECYYYITMFFGTTKNTPLSVMMVSLFFWPISLLIVMIRLTIKGTNKLLESITCGFTFHGEL